MENDNFTRKCRVVLSLIIKNHISICKCCVVLSFALIAIHIVKVCVFGLYVAEVTISIALPLSIVLVALSILFFALEHKNGDR